MKCPHCGQEFVPLEGQRFCTFCGKPLDEEQVEHRTLTEGPVADESSESLSRVTSQGSIEDKYTPWEDLENLGFLQALLQSLQQSLFSPKEFFSRLPVQGGFLNPLLYALILQAVGTMAGYLSGMTVKNPFFSQSGHSGVLIILLAVLIPIIIPIALYFWSALLHAALYLLGGANKDFEATFRVVSYSSAADLFNAVPVIGGFIALGWKTYLLIVGVREVHEITTARSAAAVFLPLILCCGIASTVVFLALVGSAGAGG